MNTLLNEVGRVVSARDAATQAGVFTDVARFLLLGARTGSAAAVAEAHGRLKAATILKSPVAVGTTTGWGEPLSEFQAVAAAWLSSLRSLSAFDAMLPSMIQVPLRVRVGTVTVGATAFSMGQGSAKTLSRLEIGAAEMEPIKAVAWLLLSKELIEFSGPAGATLFDNELRAAVAATTDVEFVAILTAGLTPITSSGTNTAAVRTDLARALAEIETDFRAKLFVITTAKIAKAWSQSNTDGGAPAFPDMGPTGGTISKVPVLVSAGVSDGQIVVADASQIAASAEGIGLSALRHASVTVEAPPDSPPTASTVQVNLWQEGKVGLVAERFFAARRLRTAAAAVIDGVSYSGDSP